MNRESPTDDNTSIDKNRSDSFSNTDRQQVEPRKFAEPHVAEQSDGHHALRLIADPRGEWLESDLVMEVER